MILIGFALMLASVKTAWPMLREGTECTPVGEQF